MVPTVWFPLRTLFFLSSLSGCREGKLPLSPFWRCLYGVDRHQGRGCGGDREASQLWPILCIPCRALWAVYKTFVLYILPVLVVVAFVQKAWEVYLVVSEIVDLYANFTKSGPDL